MKRILIYAQAPPPLHGQSLMVAYLVDGLRATGQVDLTEASSGRWDAPIGYVHINPQLSHDLSDIGRWRPGKVLRVFVYIFQAIRAKFRYGLDTFYFVPAPPKREALYRDCAVLLLCRSFFRRLILHWHCAGLPEFVEKKLSAPERWLARWCYKHAISVALSDYAGRDAEYFAPEKIAIVPNGIPDPCPQFDADLWPWRQKRAAARRQALSGESAAPFIYEVLFLAGRMTPKGLFDAMAAVTKANTRLTARSINVRMRLTAAGPFEDDAERARYEAAAKDLNATRIPGANESLAVYAGWADEKRKKELYREADCFIFPTTYFAETCPLVLAEAMAHGCGVITTRWQAVPEMLAAGDPNVVEPHDVEAMAEALLRWLAAPADRSLRDHFLARFTREQFVRDMVRVLA